MSDSSDLRRLLIDLEFSRIARSRGFDDDVKFSQGYDMFWSVEQKTAISVASAFTVGLCCYPDGSTRRNGSGVVFEHGGVNRIITSTYLIGDRSDISSLNVNVLLPNKKTITGSIVCVDLYHNLMIIRAELDEDPLLRAANFNSDSYELGVEVSAVCFNYGFEFRASIGVISVRDDHLESDDVLSSSCSIGESGIGGPLIHNGAQSVLGINFFCRRGYTPFMPSAIIRICVEQLLTHRRVIRPWIGLKTRSLEELNVDERAMIYRKFRVLEGLSVKEVIEGSPAAESGIWVGDIVIVPGRSNSIKSPFELSAILLKMYELPASGSSSPKSIEVTVLKMSTGARETISIPVSRSTPDAFNRQMWPLW